MNDNNIKAKFIGTSLGTNTSTNITHKPIKVTINKEPELVVIPPLTMEDIDEAAMCIENILQDMVENYEDSSSKSDLTDAAKSIVKLLMKNYVLGNYARKEYEDKIASLQQQLATIKDQLIENQAVSRKKDYKQYNSSHWKNKKDLS
jgi:hypothetical protein